MAAVFGGYTREEVAAVIRAMGETDRESADIRARQMARRHGLRVDAPIISREGDTWLATDPTTGVVVGVGYSARDALADWREYLIRREHWGRPGGRDPFPVRV